MNIWDSVHRGLERASHEAARIAKIQRLRFIIDGLQRQIRDRDESIVAKAMELSATGQLPQGELLSLCQEMAHLLQQFNQAQAELKQVQSQGIQAAQTGVMPQSTPPSAHPLSQENSPAVYAPPPPPGVEQLALGTLETIVMNAPESPGAGQRYCSVCYAELVSGHPFCHHCGSPVSNVSSDLPTTRGGITGPSAEVFDQGGG